MNENYSHRTGQGFGAAFFCEEYEILKYKTSGCAIISHSFSNGYFFESRMLTINAFFDYFSTNRSFAQNNRRIAGNINNGRRLAALGFPPV